tara:strand:+ start:179 stop:571 length:393 start_codon:yes stop_codon:yes gene_type:complete
MISFEKLYKRKYMAMIHSKSLGSILFFFSGLFLLSSCSSSTLIQSVPSGAKVYLDKEYAGFTPCLMEDMKISWSRTRVEIKLEGYEDFRTTITKDEEINVGALVGGVFSVVPFAWVMQYKPHHMYELEKD